MLTMFLTNGLTTDLYVWMLEIGFCSLTAGGGGRPEW